MSSENSSGVDAIGKNVKSHGKPQGLRHMTWMPIIADPTLVLQIHPGVKRTVDLDHIDIDEKVKLLLVEYYPMMKDAYNIVNYYEQMAIKILKTGMAQSRYSIRYNRIIVYC